MNAFPWITLMTLIPLVGGALLFLMRGQSPELARRLGAAFSGVAGLVALILWAGFDSTQSGLQFVERAVWVPTLNIEYFVGVDGLGILMVLLTGIVTPMAMFASWRMTDRVPLYFSLVLFLEAGLFGAFTALNFFHWFIFWELSLIPAFFLVKMWGGPGRNFAAIQFFIYTMVGSIAMLLGFLAVAYATGSFDFIRLAEMARTGELGTALSSKLAWGGVGGSKVVMLVFIGIFLGLAVKVPLIPFHIWLPPAYTEAPTGTTMLLTGVMSKMGVYGFLRILLPLFPDQMRGVMTVLLWVAVITIVYSAFAAFAQKDLKRVLAYSSINHLGYCLLGIFAAGIWTGPDPRMGMEKAAALSGVLLQMFNHGLTAAALFCFVGFLEQRSGGTRGLEEFGGLRKVAPVFCGLMGISVFASLGLPGLNGFVGEFLIFKGAFTLASWAAVISVIGLLVTAVFLLTILQRVFNGPLEPKWAKMPDLSWSERAVVFPATGLMLAIGIYPQWLVERVNATVLDLVIHLAR